MFVPSVRERNVLTIHIVHVPRERALLSKGMQRSVME